MIYLYTFLIGGAICAATQLVIDYTKFNPARILTALVVIGVFLGAIGVYQPLVDFAGAGATVPLTGFGNMLARGMEKAVAEKGALGILTGALTAASAGITSAMLFSLIAALFTRSGDK